MPEPEQGGDAMAENALRVGRMRVCIYNDGRRTEEFLGWLSLEESDRKIKKLVRYLAADFNRWRKSRSAG